MARQISRSEAWERAHEVLTQINFNAFDFNSVKESLLDYMKMYFPEDFNDYIESSEFIAILELFAYISELIAYRLDVNAHENFITTAQRKESILRLAKLISYKASRNIPARGLVKIVSVQTTETLFDSAGRNLAGRKIIWNDNNNADWKEQFLLVMNRVLEQEFGTVTPSERVQVDDVLFELYTLNNNPLTANGKNVFSYSASVTGQSFPMELVPTELLPTGPTEKRPEVNGKFSLMYATDGLGDASDTTGFLIYTKQGTLQRQQATFDGITPNQTFDLTATNINETDVWVNNVDPDTREILTQDPFNNVLNHLPDNALRFGEWVEVDLSNSQNILFNTNRNRRKYEIETLDEDRVRLVFGDGEFADIPSGSFDIWYRTSANQEISIPRSAVVNQSASFTYTDATGNIQTFTFTFSLISSLLNASPSEDIEHIRRVAPSMFYTQDRMVNGRDYNSFLLQDPTILKLRAINRTFAGDSKYIAWHDPSESYENVKIFGDDLAVYWVEKDPANGNSVNVSSPLSAEELITTYIEPLLCSTDLYGTIGAMYAQPESTSLELIRCEFSTEPYSFDENTNEREEITDELAGVTSGSVELWYSPVYDEWTVDQHPYDTILGPNGAANSVHMITVTPQFSGSTLDGWIVAWRTRRMIAHSVETNFWNVNDTSRVIDFDTLNSLDDYITILKANENSAGTGILPNNIDLTVIGQELVDVGTLPNAGLPDRHRVALMTRDVNDDNIPDNITLPELFNQVDIIALTDPRVDNVPGNLVHIDLLRTIIVGQGDAELKLYALDSSGNILRKLEYGATADWIDIPKSTSPLLSDRITINNEPVSLAGATHIRIDYIDYVYLHRETSQDPYEPVRTDDTIKNAWVSDQPNNEHDRRYIRYPGRYPLNFAWFHFTPRLSLVDPAASNIIDMFIVTRGYYLDLRRWIEGRIDDQPAQPTPLELRNTYSELLENKMISDTVILHPGKFKILFGSKALPQLQATIKIIRPSLGGNLTDNEVKVRVVTVIRNFFDLSDWEFGETFYFSELAAAIHSALGPEIDSVVLVPVSSQNQFGDLYQIAAREDELFIPDISTSNIEIVQSYTADNIRQRPN